MNFSKEKTRRRCVVTESVPVHRRTSLILRCVPKSYTRNDILSCLHRQGFAHDINLIYLPISFRTKRAMGYCLLNFRFPHDAMEFMTLVQSGGFRFLRNNHEDNAKPPVQEATAWVEWRCPMQGLASHLDKYRSCPADILTLPDAWRPTLIRDGKEAQLYINSVPYRDEDATVSPKRPRARRRWAITRPQSTRIA